MLVASWRPSSTPLLVPGAPYRCLRRPRAAPVCAWKRTALLSFYTRTPTLRISTGLPKHIHFPLINNLKCQCPRLSDGTSSNCLAPSKNSRAERSPARQNVEELRLTAAPSQDLLPTDTPDSGPIRGWPGGQLLPLSMQLLLTKTSISALLHGASGLALGRNFVSRQSIPPPGKGRG